MKMPSADIYSCKCHNCQHEASHPDQLLHHQMNMLLSRLDEQQRRWYVAVEAKRLGYGGIEQITQITGIGVKTIRRGMQELETELSTRPHDRIRLAGGGRHRVEKKTLK
jgi:hypothetical protein